MLPFYKAAILLCVYACVLDSLYTQPNKIFEIDICCFYARHGTWPNFVSEPNQRKMYSGSTFWNMTDNTILRTCSKYFLEVKVKMATSSADGTNSNTSTVLPDVRIWLSANCINIHCYYALHGKWPNNIPENLLKRAQAYGFGFWNMSNYEIYKTCTIFFTEEGKEEVPKDSHVKDVNRHGTSLPELSDVDEKPSNEEKEANKYVKKTDPVVIPKENREIIEREVTDMVEIESLDTFLQCEKLIMAVRRIRQL